MTCPFGNPYCHRETEKQCTTRNALGNFFCTLGNDLHRSNPTPIRLNPTPVVYDGMVEEPQLSYEVRARDDKITFTLSKSHRAFLKYVAASKGETPFDFSKVTPRVSDHIRLLFKMGLLSETPLVGGTRVLIRLTDTGRNIVSLVLKGES